MSGNLRRERPFDGSRDETAPRNSPARESAVLSIVQAGHEENVPAPPKIGLRPRAATVDWWTATWTASLAGVVAVALIIPVFGLGLGMISGCALSVRLYGCKSFATPGIAIKIGILSAVDEGAFFIVLTWLQARIFHTVDTFQGELRSALARAARFIDFEATSNLIRLMASPLGMLGFLFMLLIVLLTCACLGGFVGSLSARLWRQPGTGLFAVRPGVNGGQ